MRIGNRFLESVSRFSESGTDLGIGNRLKKQEIVPEIEKSNLENRETDSNRLINQETDSCRFFFVVEDKTDFRDHI